MLKIAAVTGLVFLALLAQTREENTTHVYCIIPDILSRPNCCWYYSCMNFEEFVTDYNRQENVDLLFLKGYHTLIKYGGISFVLNRNLNMTGIEEDVIIYDTELHFYDITEFQIRNIKLRNGLFEIAMAWETTNLRAFSVQLFDFVLYIKDANLAQLNGCEFTQGTNPLTVYRSKVTFSGNTSFTNNFNSAFVSYNSSITLSGTVSFINNTGIRGGAMALYSSIVYLKSALNVNFINNSAQKTGGAIHIEPDMTRNICPSCFYQFEGQNSTDIAIHYSKNRAELGGDDIYGNSRALCKFIDRTFPSTTTSTLSSVSSDPTQVCLCDSDGKPWCENTPEMLTRKSIHPGERFTIPAMIVGGDFGTTIGTIHASFMSIDGLSPQPVLESGSQYSQWIDSISECTNLQYVVNSEHIGQNFTMHLTVHFSKSLKIMSKNIALCDIKRHGFDPTTPAFINLTVLPCPAGFSLRKETSSCDCHSILTNNRVECEIIDGKSSFSWNNTLWINVTQEGFTYAKYCPLHYCRPAEKRIELENYPSAQCASNRAGRLCGRCREGYSLALGSSHCIHCPNNNGLSLIVFFAAAGFLLVFFINVLDITLTQGLFDGLIFYANIVWTYQSVLFPEYYDDTNAAVMFLKTFIAWLNLDFGIEICFVKGLTAYWKTWLQFVFPLYIWAIVGLMILSARHSRTLTRIYGNRTVPVLATLFLLSYMKLLRTVTSIYLMSVVLHYPKKSKTIVWSVDGNIDYFGLSHSFLLVAALTVQIFLWLPYTLTLLLHQKLQKMSHLWIFKWVTSLKPFFDVHFTPFKLAHRYWFGVLLLARGLLLIIFSSSYATPQNTNLLLLLALVLLLLLYMAIVQPYKNKVVLIIQTSYLANLLLLSAFILYTETMDDNRYTVQTIAVGVSTGIVFLQFCGIIVCNIIRLCFRSKRCKLHRYRANFEEDELELDEKLSTKYRTYVVNALF